MLKKALPWVLAIVPAIVFLQTLPFKFTGHPMTQHIFSTIGDWFSSLGLAPLDTFFTHAGAYVIGAFEALAAIALLIPSRRHYGALLGTALLAGAIFFHIATPLGIAVQFPGEDAPDSSLFLLAVAAFACCLTLVLMNVRRFRGE
ncbi:MAG: hypothetical protein AAGA68_24755 [Pseudomonadota bacterium]